MGHLPPDDDEREAPLDSWEGAGSGAIDPTLLRRHSDVGEIIAREGKRRLEAQMAQAERLAMLGQRTANVVHELNNPLTSVSAHAGQLLAEARREGSDARAIERLSRIVEAAARMTDLTQGLAELSRPASRQTEEISVEEVLGHALELCDHVLVRDSVEITRSVETSLPTIRASRSQLLQILINLITNACHATPDEDGRVEVKLRRSAEGDVEITIRDNGEGVPIDLRATIFDPFFTTKAEGEGTGLGLPIVRSFVERHGGTIHLADDEGQGGACFVVRLPGV